MDKLIIGLEVTLIGLVIVFVMLMLIIGVVKVIALAGGFVDKKTEQLNAKKAAKKAAKAAQEAKEEPVEAAFAPEPVAMKEPAEAAPAPVAEAVVSEPVQADDTELIAVIAAACAVMMDTVPQNVAVRSVKRVRRTAWAEAGRRSQMS